MDTQATAPSAPGSHRQPECIELAHGGGGRLSRDLIHTEILARFGQTLTGLPDAATLPSPGPELVFTTDSYVVQPLEFHGGNIGHLAVHGTVNDLAVCGGRPLWLSLGMILEEGLPLDVLRRVLDTVRDAARASGVAVVTGDTKVVPRGLCDGMYLNTSGIGRKLPGFNLGTSRLRAGDHVLVSGPLAEHGFAVLAARQGLAIRGGPVSDTAPVYGLVEVCESLAGGIRFMRDPTRGGLAAVLNECVEGRPIGIELEEERIPLSPGVRALAELLGLDPLHVASEGRLVLICAAEVAAEVLARWRRTEGGADCARIGGVTGDGGRVVLRTSTGGRRLVDVPRGELLPRIC
jgi:hydrogenase expression/formation protein HypE